MGKLLDKELETLLSCVNKDARVIIPPTVGYDSGVHALNDKCVVVSTDPCIGVPEDWFGWLLIHYAASDVAVFGAAPQFCAINLLGSPQTKPSVFKKVMEQACRAADEIDATIVTGHTGTYDSLKALTGTCTAYGIIRREQLITPAGARPGDYIMCTKPIGLETLVNFSLTHKKLAAELFGRKAALSLQGEIRMQTCVPEALALAETGGVTAMHDATEGGFVAALNEVADASKVGFSIDSAKVPILPEFDRLVKHFNLSRDETLSASSTGMLLAAVSSSRRGEAVASLSKVGLSAKVVGVFTRGSRRLINVDGIEKRFPRRADDPYAKIMKTSSARS